MIKKIMMLIVFSSIFAQDGFDVTINNTGESHLIIFLNSITGLDTLDQVGVFDSNGVLETVDSPNSPEY